ncbi:MAG: LptF/LptG family permease [Prosthecobacter sp.]|uniref:LptF/LptG family permease n=1 Tax=Prosthecobacter sp. TaxID=1965333 RepID=UPI0019DA3B24|nr:LptF/LptG family permease [Prosthecobacter sp.]MBE2287270.1 LptF/LptG family permease [Prosthecobacter sp.]
MFPRIFDRYLGRQVGTATLIGVALLSGVMVLGNVYKKLDELLGNTELPISVILEFVAMVIPFSLIFTIPWAFLTAILLVFGRLSADNELVSLRMTGMSMTRICAPVFVLAVALSGICLWVNVILAPAAKDHMKRLFYQVAVKNPETLFQEGQVLERVPGYRIYTGKRNDKALTDLHIIKLGNSANAESYIHADSGMIQTVEGKLDFNMLLKDVHIEHLPAAKAEGQPIVPKPSSLTEFPIEFPLSDMQQDAVRVNASMKSTAALNEEVRTWKDTFTGEHLTEVARSLSRTELHKRYSFSLACLTFALVGIPLGVTAQRRETSSGFALSLGTATVYMVFIILADNFNDKPAAMPHLMMWLPNALFLGIGGWLFYKLGRK